MESTNTPGGLEMDDDKRAMLQCLHQSLPDMPRAVLFCREMNEQDTLEEGLRSLIGLLSFLFAVPLDELRPPTPPPQETGEDTVPYAINAIARELDFAQEVIEEVDFKQKQMEAKLLALRVTAKELHKEYNRAMHKFRAIGKRSTLDPTSAALEFEDMMIQAIDDAFRRRSRTGGEF